MKSPTLKRRSKWRSGSVFETVMLMPAVVVQLAASFWLWQVYEGKLTVMKAARGPVFTQAIGGCVAGAEDDAVKTADADAQDEAIEGVDLSVVGRKLAQAPGRDVLDRRSGGRVGRVVRTVEGFAGSSNVKLGGTAVMPCNEGPADGELAGMKALATGGFDPRSP